MHKRAHQFHDFIQHIDKNYLWHHKILFLFVLLPLFIFYGIFNAVFLLFSSPYHSFKFWKVHHQQGHILSSYTQHLDYKKKIRFLSLVFSIFVIFFVCLAPILVLQAETPKVYTVTKSADTNDGLCDADCSLREAITAANASADNNKLIEFTIPPTDIGCVDTVCTIAPSKALPNIGTNITINGYSQPGAAQNSNDFPQAMNAQIKIVIDGISAGATTKGLAVNNKQNNIIKGLSIVRFNGYAVYFTGANNGNNKIQGCFIGILPDGVTVMANKNYGIVNNAGADNNIIGVDGDGNNDVAERNLISGNTGSGIWLGNSGGLNITVAGNFIGTDNNGTVDLGNTASGIKIENAVNNNIIGTDGDGISDQNEGNLIAGNGNYGIYAAGDNNIIAGNIVSCDATGNNLLQNDGDGIGTLGSNIRIGTNADGVSDILERNYLCGNQTNPRRAVIISGANNIIKGNYFGVNFNGTSASGSAARGIEITRLSNNCIVGTDGDGVRDDIEGNVISGKALVGIIITGGTGHRIAGNVIGLNAAGTQAIDSNNSQYGIRIYSGSDALIGTNTDGISDSFERNIIAGHKNYEIFFEGAATNTNIIGNYIGVDISGQIALGSGSGIFLGTATSTSSGNQIKRNVISGNTGSGIMLYNADNNSIANNYIGVAADGKTPLGNKQHGIFINSSGYGAVNTTIDGNIIANNGNTTKEYGVFLNKANSDNNKILNNIFYNNFDQGIKLNQDGANNNIVAPIILSDNRIINNQSLLQGTAKANSIVQFFTASSDNEGQTFLIQTTADLAGKWSAVLNSPASDTGKIIIATATDSADGTSEFAAPYAITGYHSALVISNNNQIIDEDAIYSGVLATVNDEFSQPTFSIIDNPVHGVVQIADNANGDFIYTPDSNYFGADSFTYKVNDGISDSNTAAYYFNINPVNDLPVITNIEDQTITAGNRLTIEIKASDIDTNLLRISISDIQHNFYNKNINLSDYFVDNGNNTGVFSWQPDANQTGLYAVSFFADDGMNTATDSININVIADQNSNKIPSLSFTHSLPNVSFFAGTETQSLFNLNDYFINESSNNVDYGVANASRIQVNINNGHVSMSAPADFIGTEIIYFTATSGEESAQSNYLNITVSELKNNDINYITGTSSGKGTIRVYDKNNNILAQWNAFSVGGVIPKLGLINDESYIFAIKQHSGTTLHIYSTTGKAILEKRLSAKLHRRQLIISNFNNDQTNDEIAVTTKHGSNLYCQIFGYQAKINKFTLLTRNLITTVGSDYRLSLENRKILIVADRHGRTIKRWQPFK